MRTSTVEDDGRGLRRRPSLDRDATVSGLPRAVVTRMAPVGLATRRMRRAARVKTFVHDPPDAFFASGTVLGRGEVRANTRPFFPVPRLDADHGARRGGRAGWQRPKRPLRFGARALAPAWALARRPGRRPWGGGVSRGGFLLGSLSFWLLPFSFRRNQGLLLAGYPWPGLGLPDLPLRLECLWMTRLFTVRETLKKQLKTLPTLTDGRIPPNYPLRTPSLSIPAESGPP